MSIYLNSTRQRLVVSLIIFSTLLTCIAGIVWACADAGNDDVSSFAPEFFVNKHYSPFFYDSYDRYYYGADSSQIVDNNSRYNKLVSDEWHDFLKNQLSDKQLEFLLFKSTQKQSDSLQRTVANKLNGQGKTFFNYLPLMKDCETYTVSNVDYWYEKTPRRIPPATIEKRINSALTAFHDPFIRERLWFQLVRFHYFQDTTGVKAKQSFYKYEKEFPHNLLYYRSLGYLAGAEYYEKDYAHANYHYSLCYNFTWQMYLPNQWSFHPQEEKDWQQTLKLAKSTEEKITLWHLLGISQDPGRAIQMIAALNPKSEKLDLLLSRLINETENADKQTLAKLNNRDVKILDGVSSLKTISKPYFWHLATGYLHYLHADYPNAKRYYDLAKKEIPANDVALNAQFKLLNILLSVTTINHIDKKAETQLVEPLNWLADLRDNKKTIHNLRFMDAVSYVTDTLSGMYQLQHEKIKAQAFKPRPHFYVDSTAIDAMTRLMLKSNKTPFEKAMLRFYPIKIEQLNYQQMLLAVYRENIKAAIGFLAKNENLSSLIFLANPFSDTIMECHDCEFDAWKDTLNDVQFLNTLQQLRRNIASGKNVYQSALKMGNAYYNLTHYGNSRIFFQTDLTSFSSEPGYYDDDYFDLFTSQNIAEKYYKLALGKATNNEQRAHLSFLLSKCERNTYFNKGAKADPYGGGGDSIPPAGQWFKALKSYSATNYYKEVLKECGYFKVYVAKH